MPKVVNIHEAKTHLSKLLEEVKNGKEIIIARAGKPCARLIPYERPGKRPLGFVPGKLTEDFFKPLPEEEIEAWELNNNGR